MEVESLCTMRSIQTTTTFFKNYKDIGCNHINDQLAFQPDINVPCRHVPRVSQLQHYFWDVHTSCAFLFLGDVHRDTETYEWIFPHFAHRHAVIVVPRRLMTTSSPGGSAFPASGDIEAPSHMRINRHLFGTPIVFLTQIQEGSVTFMVIKS